ncbi:mannitol dehydrogenase family protein [soil metagenome]
MPPTALIRTTPDFGFDNLPSHVKPAGYETADVHPGITHIGPGGFFAAHLAAYVNEYMAKTGDLRWGIVVASLRSPGTIMALRNANNRIVLVEREGTERSTQVLAPIVGTIYAPENPLALVNAIAAASTKIVSMTVTNKGYCVSDAHGTLDTSKHEVVHDLDFQIENRVGTDAPLTVHWYLMAGLAQRKAEALASGIPSPLTILSLDNVPQNSKSLKTALLQYIEAATESSAELIEWINDNVDWLTTLVDRITPEVTNAFRKETAELIGFDAPVVVGTEKFKQFVVELGRFDMPDWSDVGVETVDDISSYWELKFLGLNAAHQVPAMVGPRLGATFIHEAVLIAEVGALLELFHRELGVILGDQLMAEYGAKIQQRFRDSAPMDTIRRVGARGTSKASERIAYAVERALEITDGAKVLKAPTFVFACWLLNMGCSDELGNSFEQDDKELPKLSIVYHQLLAWTRSPDHSHHALAHLLRTIGEICSDNRFVVMASKEGFLSELTWALLQLTTGDTKTAICNLLARSAADLAPK